MEIGSIYSAFVVSLVASFVEFDKACDKAYDKEIQFLVKKNKIPTVRSTEKEHGWLIFWRAELREALVWDVDSKWEQGREECNHPLRQSLPRVSRWNTEARKRMLVKKIFRRLNHAEIKDRLKAFFDPEKCL
jgi:hypothetical protein